jgi:antitoxin ParD1/3/4
MTNINISLSEYGLMANSQTQNQLNDEEFETIADQLADEFASYFGSNIPALSDYAVSREGIYEELDIITF